jgi:hypothetical protein
VNKLASELIQTYDVLVFWYFPPIEILDKNVRFIVDNLVILLSLCANLPRFWFQMDVMILVLDIIGIFQSVLVYTVNNVFLSRSITSITFDQFELGSNGKT